MDKMSAEANKRAIPHLKRALIILGLTNRFEVKNFTARQNILKLIDYLEEEQNA